MVNVLAAVLVIAYYGGLIVSVFVYPARVGLGMQPLVYASAWLHVPSRRNGIPWLIKTVFKVFGWPIVFAKWLLDGRPASKVLYGYAAAENMGFTGDELPYHMRGFASKWRAATSN